MATKYGSEAGSQLINNFQDYISNSALQTISHPENTEKSLEAASWTQEILASLG